MLGPQLLCLLFIVIFLSLHPEFSAFNLVLLLSALKPILQLRVRNFFGACCLISANFYITASRLVTTELFVVEAIKKKKMVVGNF